MEITMGFWEADLVGAGEGFDVRASVSTFARQLRAELAAAFPDAAIHVRAGRGGTGALAYALRTTIDGRQGAPESDLVQEIAERVWRGFDWLVGARESE